MAVTYRYKMVGIASALLAEMNADPSTAAAKYLEDAVNEYTRAGWEFYRVDHLEVAKKQGCLGFWLGSRSLFVSYPVITFRRPVTVSPTTSQREMKPSANG